MDALLNDKNATVAVGSTSNEQLIPDILGDALVAAVTSKEPLPADPFSAFEPKSKFRRIISNRGVQICPLAVFFGFAAGIFIPVFTELMRDRVCENELHYNRDLCKNLTVDATASNRVRSVTANFMLYNSLLSSIPSIVFSLFVGSWSDRFGRKMPMMSSFFGCVISSGFLLAYAYLEHLRAGYLLVASVVSSLFGGWTIFLMSTLSYIGDYTTERTRAMIISLFSGFLGIGLSMGQLVGTDLLQAYGYAAPFYAYLACHAAGLLYTIVVVRDHTNFTTKEEEATRKSKFLQIFEVQSLKDNWAMLRQRRANSGRLLIIVSLIGYTASMMCIETEGTVLQLFLRFPPLSWSITQYGRFAMAQGIINCIFLSIAIPVFKKVFHLSDSTVGIIAAMSGIACVFTYALSTKAWMVYVGLVLGVLRPLLYICLQSTLIGLVAKDEVGKISSVVSIIQSVSMIFSAMAFVEVFSTTAAWWPGFVFAVEAFVMVIPLASFCFVDIGLRNIVPEAEAVSVYQSQRTYTM
ncbi:proton-coupled folate transporter-like [Paramacrobiotus metropolitanus]|uniref:proton-coupled folate transporter-like n=1 Tax=Paramacrobiotus metropolitanus TaxID=2943436 RepID=UPI0024459892|nr:proton-coupled folate transporter-like [Paramacrobiotus metropolitanus]